MGRKDKLVVTVMLIFILANVSVLIIGILINKLPFLTGIVNFIAAVCILTYWVQKQIRVTQHFIECREITVLFFEFFIAVSFIFFITTGKCQAWQRILQYVFFGMHFLALIAGLIFMLTFKIKRMI